MKPLHRTVLSFILIVTLAAFVYSSRTPAQPSYQGKPLSAWLSEMDPGGDSREGWHWQKFPANGSGSEGSPQEAVQKIGTNALPFLLKYLGYKEPRFYGWLKAPGVSKLTDSQLPVRNAASNVLKQIAGGAGAQDSVE